MSFWRSLGLIRKDQRNCFQTGFLLVRANGEIKKRPFKFSIVSDTIISKEMSVMPMEYDKKVKQIFTPAVDLPFANGGRIEFTDGHSMVISSVTEVIDEEKAQSDGKGLIGLNINLGGWYGL